MTTGRINQVAILKPERRSELTPPKQSVFA